MSDKFQFVFQGGGAKLGVLLAAAEAAYAQRAANNFAITRISGTSAGAIAACVLATGENPAVFRLRLERLSAQYLEDIENKSVPLVRLYRMCKGTPVYNAIVYKQFLRDLFQHETKRWESIKDLNIDVSIHAVDMYSKKEIIYNKDSAISIADALFDSSALPFIFRTHSDVSSIVDGGLTNNFPSDHLQKDNGVGRYGPIIGFSFASEAIEANEATGVKGISAFAGALISTMIDIAATKSLARLPIGDVHYFNTATSTLDWQQGLKDLRAPLFNGYFDDAKRFIDDVVIRYRMTPSVVSKAEMTKRILQLHKGLQTRQSHIKVTRIILTYTCNGLKERNPDRGDNLQYITEIASVSEPVFTFGVRVTVGDQFHGTDVTIWVVDDRNMQVETTVMPISPDSLDGEVPDNNFLLFFHQPLVPGRTYRINMSLETREVMYELSRPAGQDVVAYLLRNMDEVEEVNVVVLLPTSIPRASLSLVQASGSLPEGMRWGNGRSLEDGEMVGICSPLFGFYPVGWRGQNVVRGVAIGFMAIHMSSGEMRGER
jgi:predicted acylesterase/phospholipase RssA